MEFITTIIQASIRGDKEEGIPNQDYIEIVENEEVLIATVSDGLGSSKHSLDGAKLACKTIIEEVTNFKRTTDLHLLNEQIKRSWENEIYQISDFINDFRTTNSFVAVLKKEKKIIVGQLGDVLISLRIDGLFRYLQSESKDFSNETECLGSRKSGNYYLTEFDFSNSFDFLMATDGIGDEVETDKIESLHDYFISKFMHVKASLRNDVLKQEIEDFVNKKNNDDKSIVFIWTNKI